MSEFSIRVATVDDVPLVHQLLIRLAAELGHSTDMTCEIRNLEKYGFSDRSFFSAMLAFTGNEAVGLVVYFSEYSTWRGVPGVYVQDLYVSEKARGAGLGRLLLQSVMADSSHWGARYMKLTVHGVNPDAVAFYQRLGFEARDDELPLVLKDF
jgi:GNAT superfamily N-acetyltransferase